MAAPRIAMSSPPRADGDSISRLDGNQGAPDGAVHRFGPIEGFSDPYFDNGVKHVWYRGGRRAPPACDGETDPDLPLEVLRTVHSFDPCLARAIHMVDAKGGSVARIQTH